jgi:chemosensory pili system protein ChpA (sensor histidine kinase/response regulator)
MSLILVVDDSETVLNFLRAVFEAERCDVVTAIDGNDALAKVHQSLPDLIVTDSIMPNLDGFGLLRSLRSDPATEAVPVIMLTSGSPDDPDHIAREPRPDAFVRKSADVAPLLAEVREFLARVR